MRVSVTDIEQYRRYCSGIMSYDELIYGLAKGFKMTPAISVGVQIHKFIESGHIPETFFTPEGVYVDMSMLGEIELMSPNCEVPIQWQSKCGVLVSGRVDAIAPINGVVYDHKVTGDTKGYLDSIQWRLYLAMTGLRKFVYNVFFRGDIVGDRECSIIGFHEEHYTAYDGMIDECEDAVSDYKTHIYKPVFDLKQQLRQEKEQQSLKIESALETIQYTILSGDIIYPYDGKDMFSLLKEIGFSEDQIDLKKETFQRIVRIFNSQGVVWNGKEFIRDHNKI